MWRNFSRHSVLSVSAVTLLLLCASLSHAQTLSSNFSSGGYTLENLGAVPAGALGSLGNYGGITLKAGDASKILVGANSGTSGGRIVETTVVRSSGHISSFTGTTTQFATAANIDGGLTYHSSGVLFATTTNNLVYQYKTGSTMPDKTTDAGTLTNSANTGSINFVPQGYHGAGEARITTYTTSVITGHTLTADGSGTFTISANTSSQTLNSSSPTDKGIEAINWVPVGSPVFDSNKQYVLINEFNTGVVAAYEWILNSGTGQVDLSTRQIVVSGLTTPNGGFIDPTTGDYLFTTFGVGAVEPTVYAIRGFAPVPEPTGILAASAGVGLALSYLRRRRRMQLTSDQPAVA